MSKTAVIFDLDGVLVDTAKYHYLAWKKLANELGFDFTIEQNELLKGVSRVKSFEILLEIGKVSVSEEDKVHYLHQKNEHYLSFVHQMTDSEMLPNMKENLHYLKENGISIALGSASKNAKLILDTLKINHYFDVIIDGNEVSKAKPNPEVFLLAAQRLNKLPNECIVVEDAAAGIEAAVNAQMECIGIGNKEILKGASLVLADTSQLTTKIFENLLKI